MMPDNDGHAGGLNAPVIIWLKLNRKRDIDGLFAHEGCTKTLLS
jgi:hypothetical protein